MTETLLHVTEGGAHVGVRVFTRQPPTATWAKAGELTFSEAEWPSVRDALPGGWGVVTARFKPLTQESMAGKAIVFERDDDSVAVMIDGMVVAEFPPDRGVPLPVRIAVANALGRIVTTPMIEKNAVLPALTQCRTMLSELQWVLPAHPDGAGKRCPSCDVFGEDDEEPTHDKDCGLAGLLFDLVGLGAEREQTKVDA